MDRLLKEAAELSAEISGWMVRRPSPEHVAQIAGTAVLVVFVPASVGVPANDDETDSNGPSNDAHHPKRLVRTCLSSLCNSKEFGLRMSREAKRRRLHEAPRKAYLGDGLPANWTIWRKHFREFVPILDSMHAVEYVYAAALVMFPGDAQAAWSQATVHSPFRY